MSFMNHFGSHSQDYLRFRPDYPEALYQFLASLVSEHDLAWDVGTGNGQAASEIAKYFKKVIATDINVGQIQVAIQKPNIEYRILPAEKTDLLNQSVDMITVAQALHWFNLPNFYAEVKRVAKKNAVLAAWTYGLFISTEEIDAVIKKLYLEILKECWPIERKYIDEEYKTIPFPFPKIPSPNFYIEKLYGYDNLLGYLHTWSAVKEYHKRFGSDPLKLIIPDLQKAWGDLASSYTVRWPIHLLLGYLNQKEALPPHS